MSRNTISRIAALAVAGIAAASLAACDTAESTTQSSNSVVTVTESAAAEPVDSGEFLDDYSSPLSPSQGERAFLVTLENEGIYGSDEELVAAGKQACSLFDSGLDGYDMILELMSESTDLLPQTDPEQEAFIVGAATGVMCPQHQALVDELA